MIKEIMEAVSLALNAEFGDGYRCYIEEISQELNNPCFFIQCLNPTDKLFFGKRYFRSNQFCIQYFPEETHHRNQECHAVGERLFSCLEYLNGGDDLVMGTKLTYEITEGILHFFVNYDMFVYRIVPAATEMGEIEIIGAAERRGDGEEKES